MRIAVLVIGLCLTGLIGLQSCTLMLGGGLVQDKGLSGGGATGILVAFLFVLGAAFSLGLPRVSAVLFALAAACGFAVGYNTEFWDMRVWGWIAAALAVMSYLGSRELRKKKAVPPA